MPRTQYPAVVQPPSSAPERVTVDRWQQPLYEPPRRSPGVPAAACLAAASGGVLGQTGPFAEITTASRWWQPLSEPARQRSPLPAAARPFLPTLVEAAPFPETGTLDRWLYALGEPTRPRVLPLPAADQPTTVLGRAGPYPETISVDRWLLALTEPVRSLSPLPAAAKPFLPTLVQAGVFNESITADRYLQQLSQPVWAKPPLPAGAVPHAFLVEAAPFPETPAPDKWFAWLADAPRQVTAGRQNPFTTYPPISGGVSPPGDTVTVDKWWRWLEDPVRLRTGLAAAAQAFAQVDPGSLLLRETTRADRWFIALGQPVFQLRSLPVSGHQTLALVLAPPFAETVFLDRWLRALDEPVRPPVWSRAAQQAASTGPLGLLLLIVDQSVGLEFLVRPHIGGLQFEILSSAAQNPQHSISLNNIEALSLAQEDGQSLAEWTGIIASVARDALSPIEWLAQELRDAFVIAEAIGNVKTPPWKIEFINGSLSRAGLPLEFTGATRTIGWPIEWTSGSAQGASRDTLLPIELAAVQRRPTGSIAEWGSSTNTVLGDINARIEMLQQQQRDQFPALETIGNVKSPPWKLEFGGAVLRRALAQIEFAGATRTIGWPIEWTSGSAQGASRDTLLPIEVLAAQRRGAPSIAEWTSSTNLALRDAFSPIETLSKALGDAFLPGESIGNVIAPRLPIEWLAKRLARAVIALEFAGSNRTVGWAIEWLSAATQGASRDTLLPLEAGAISRSGSLPGATEFAGGVTRIIDALVRLELLAKASADSNGLAEIAASTRSGLLSATEFAAAQSRDHNVCAEWLGNQLIISRGGPLENLLAAFKSARGLAEALVTGAFTSSGRAEILLAQAADPRTWLEIQGTTLSIFDSLAVAEWLASRRAGAGLLEVIANTSFDTFLRSESAAQFTADVLPQVIEWLKTHRAGAGVVEFARQLLSASGPALIESLGQNSSINSTILRAEILSAALRSSPSLLEVILQATTGGRSLLPFETTGGIVTADIWTFVEVLRTQKLDSDANIVEWLGAVAGIVSSGRLEIAAGQLADALARGEFAALSSTDQAAIAEIIARQSVSGRSLAELLLTAGPDQWVATESGFLIPTALLNLSSRSG